MLQNPALPKGPTSLRPARGLKGLNMAPRALIHTGMGWSSSAVSGRCGKPQGSTSSMCFTLWSRNKKVTSDIYVYIYRSESLCRRTRWNRIGQHFGKIKYLLLCQSHYDILCRILSQQNQEKWLAWLILKSKNLPKNTKGPLIDISGFMSSNNTKSNL